MRLIAVLGYSDGKARSLHPICAARLARAESEARPEDTVLLSGWARGRGSPPEAELMARSWSSPSRRVLLDRNARSTAGNVLGAIRAARQTGAHEIVLVTSRWHARRTSALAHAALFRSRIKVTVIAADDPAAGSARLRELACWTVLPFQAFVAARTR